VHSPESLSPSPRRDDRRGPSFTPRFSPTWELLERSGTGIDDSYTDSTCLLVVRQLIRASRTPRRSPRLGLILFHQCFQSGALCYVASLGFCLTWLLCVSSRHISTPASSPSSAEEAGGGGGAAATAVAEGGVTGAASGACMMTMARCALVVLFLCCLVLEAQAQTPLAAVAPSPYIGFPPQESPAFAGSGGPVLYITYGALSANRSPCPAGAGRSYYTPNCGAASGPPNPYSRGCSYITRCARV
jgi:hypothetical protein